MDIHSYKNALGEALANQAGLTLTEIEQAAPDFWGPGGVEDAIRLAQGNRLPSQKLSEEIIETFSLLRTSDIPIQEESLRRHLREMNARTVALWQFACQTPEWEFVEGHLEGPEGSTVHPAGMGTRGATRQLKYGYVANCEGPSPQFRGDIGDAIAVAVSQQDERLRLEAGPVSPGPMTVM